MSQSPSLAGLRVVSFNVLPQMYGLISRWAHSAGVKIPLVVTTPGPSTRPTPSFRDVALSAAAERRDVLVTTRLRTVVAPLLRELKPDLILSASFPYLLPPEVLSTARLAAVNLHPTPLPHYRGPNPMRLMYDGYPQLGVTLHYTDAEFDTGDILARHVAPLPDPLTAEAVLAVWPQLMMQALSEGVAKAAARLPGTRQDNSQASYAAQFTDADRWLDWTEPARVIQRRVVALTFVGGLSAKARIGQAVHSISRATAVDGDFRKAEPGEILQSQGEELWIATGDGVVKITAKADSG